MDFLALSRMWAQVSSEAVEEAEAVAEAKYGPKGKGGKGGFKGAAQASSFPDLYAKTFQQWEPETYQPDPDVVAFCKNYKIEEHVMGQLDELMKNRKATFEEDMLRLTNDLDRCRNPNGLLICKIKQMREGTFVGQWLKPDPEINHFTKKFNLDAEAQKRFAECICRHTPAKRQAVYMELELHLEASQNPSAFMMMNLKKIGDGESLGPVQEHAGGGKGKKGDKGDSKGDSKGGKDDRRDDRRDDRGRERERDREPNRDQRDRRGEDRDRNRGYNDDRHGDRGNRDSDRNYDKDRRDRDYGDRDRDRDRNSGRNYDRDRRDDRSRSRGHGDGRDRRDQDSSRRRDGEFESWDSFRR